MNVFVDEQCLSYIPSGNDEDGWVIPENPLEWVTRCRYLYVDPETSQVTEMTYGDVLELFVENFSQWNDFYMNEANNAALQAGVGPAYTTSGATIPSDVTLGYLRDVLLPSATTPGQHLEYQYSAIKQIMLNHIISSCFEIYFKIFAGLEVNEYSFPTDSSSVLRIMVNDIAKDGPVADLGGEVDDDGVPNISHELFMSNAVNTKGELARAISPKIFNRVFHVPLSMPDLFFYTPHIGTSPTKSAYEKFEQIMEAKNLTGVSVYDSQTTFDGGYHPFSQVVVPNTSTGEVDSDGNPIDDVGSGLSGGVKFSVLYFDIERS